MSLLSRASDTFYAFRFLRLLTTPWRETGAFKAGIIDDTGKVIKKAETQDEKSVYNIFHRLVFNIKRLINKVPLGKSTLASYITSLFLIKEETGLDDSTLALILEGALGLKADEITSLITEDTNKILAEGTYVLKHDIPFAKTGEMIIRKNSCIIAESNLHPVG